MNAALILSGGSGQRFKSSLPKQYHRILGKMVIEYVIEEALAAEKIDCVMIAGAPCASLSKIAKKYPEIKFAPGGKKRNETILNGLQMLSSFLRPRDYPGCGASACDKRTYEHLHFPSGKRAGGRLHRAAHHRQFGLS